MGVPYDLVIYDRDPVTRLAPPEYRALHPFGTAPVITDGDLLLGESGAIMEYIIGRHGGGRLAVTPAEPDYAQYLYWFHFANASLMPSELVGMITHMLGGGDAAIVTALNARSDRAFTMTEARLGETPYLAGDRFTAAYIIMFSR